MSKAGNVIASFVLGAAVGVALGYVLATDKEHRQEDLDKLKKSVDALKNKYLTKKEKMDIEEQTYHS